MVTEAVTAQQVRQQIGTGLHHIPLSLHPVSTPMMRGKVRPNLKLMRHSSSVLPQVQMQLLKQRKVIRSRTSDLLLGSCLADGTVPEHRLQQLPKLLKPHLLPKRQHHLLQHISSIKMLQAMSL